MERTHSPWHARRDLLSRACFQFLIGNPDAHAKNYALVHRQYGIELAPFYDLNNAAAFESHFKARRPRLAMAVGGERNPDLLTYDHWEAFAREIGMDEGEVMDMLLGMAARMPQAMAMARGAVAGTEADTELLDVAVNDVTKRCTSVLSWPRRSARRRPALSGMAPPTV